jgi:hypothetical protein
MVCHSEIVNVYDSIDNTIERSKIHGTGSWEHDRAGYYNQLIMSVSQLKLNLVEGSMAFRFSAEAARDLQAAIAQLMESLKASTAKAAVGSAGKGLPQKPMEYQYTGDVFLEIFCNPNIWPSPFAAKVLVTLRDDRIRVTTEAELSRLIEDVNLFLEEVA